MFQVTFFGIASKRYALYIPDSNGQPRLVDRSEHGLGHYLPPTTEPSAFYDRFWAHLLCVVLRIPDDEPDWLDHPAIGRLTVTSPHEARNFRTFNDTRDYADQVRPFNFLLLAPLHPYERANNAGSCLIAPYERDPEQWTSLAWYDRQDKRASAARIRTDHAWEPIQGEGAVQTFRDVLHDHAMHPETKLAAPDHGLTTPCTATRGLLQPRRIQAAPLERIGKETGRLTSHP